MIDVSLAAKLFAALFAMMSPLSVIPVFMTLTADLSPAERRGTLAALLTTVAVGMLVCAVAGQALLGLFGIDIAHFRLAGGLIVLTIALSMLKGDDDTSHHGTDSERQQFRSVDNPGIYPLGLPIAFGPGTMATIIVFAHSARSAAEIAAFSLGLAGYFAFFAASMMLAPWLGSRLSPTALTISKRLMGIILAAIAMEMIGGALTAMFPGWLH